MSRRAIVLLAVLLAATGTPSTATADDFTLEEVLSFPYAYPASAASDAPRIAWKAMERGVRNLWTASAPDFEAVRLTSHTEDDGQNLGGLQLTPDGGTLIYLRGNGRNRAGEHANPTSHPDGAGSTVWTVATDGSSEPRRLAGGANPTLSPDGTRLLFQRGGTVYEIDLSADGAEEGEDDEEDGEGSVEFQELFQVRGGVSQLTWSPDGSRVAFASGRGTHSFVGVFDREADAIRWMAPSVDRDDLPAWSPDGTRLAFLRAPGGRAGERFDLTSGNPFAVVVADAATGEGREVWRSRPWGQEAEPGREAGGFAQYYPTVALRWVAPDSGEGGGDHLLFTSEQSGWLHVHALPLGEDGAAGEVIDLTPGACESEASAATEDGGTLIFSANCGDLAAGDRRALWRVPTTGGTPERIGFDGLEGEGIATDPVLFGDGWLAFRRATARRPQAMTVARLDGSSARTLGPALPDSFPVDALVEPTPIVLEAADGFESHAQVFEPPGGASEDRDRPAVIFLHGGPIRQMLLGWHYSDYYARTYAMNQYLASRGYVVLALNFRAGIGYGQAFRRAEGQGPRGATEYRDVLAAARYLRERPDVDPERIGLWGGSYGGYLTALGLARDSDLFAAGVDLHGVHDWKLRATDFVEGGAWGLTEDLLDAARESSPVAAIDGWTSPVLLVHGDDDRNVLFLQTTDLAQRLRERKVEVEVLVLPDEVHGFLRHESWLRVLTAADRFFARHLRGESTGPPVRN